MKEELASLHQKETWELVEKPKEQRVLPCSWVLTKKLNSDGSIQRYKARLVILGNHQQAGIDFHETFSPTLKFNSLRLMLHIATDRDWEILQFDIKTAFLNGTLDEDIYMMQPDGFPKHRDSEGELLVCKLSKSLYGLKQAPRQ
jgi:hypothetical protein